MGTAAPVEDEPEAEAELVSPLKESKLEAEVPEADAVAVAAEEADVAVTVAEPDEELEVDLLLFGVSVIEAEGLIRLASELTRWQRYRTE